MRGLRCTGVRVNAPRMSARWRRAAAQCRPQDLFQTSSSSIDQLLGMTAVPKCREGKCQWAEIEPGLRQSFGWAGSLRLLGLIMSKPDRGRWNPQFLRNAPTPERGQREIDAYCCIQTQP